MNKSEFNLTIKVIEKSDNKHFWLNQFVDTDCTFKARELKSKYDDLNEQYFEISESFENRQATTLIRKTSCKIIKPVLQKFEISFGIISRLIKAKNFSDLIDNRMTQQERENFQSITFIDSYDDKIFNIDRQTFDEWSRDKCLQDCIDHQDDLDFLRDDHKLFLEHTKR